jgi:cytochrome c553
MGRLTFIMFLLFSVPAGVHHLFPDPEGGYKVGAPALGAQHAASIERQVASFAQGIRQHDIHEQMQAIARQLTPDEMKAVAEFTSAQGRAFAAN